MAGHYGLEGTEPLRAFVFWLLYTVPSFLYENSRWMPEERDRAVAMAR